MPAPLQAKQQLATEVLEALQLLMNWDCLLPSMMDGITTFIRDHASKAAVSCHDLRWAISMLMEHLA